MWRVRVPDRVLWIGRVVSFLAVLVLLLLAGSGPSTVTVHTRTDRLLVSGSRAQGKLFAGHDRRVVALLESSADQTAQLPQSKAVASAGTASTALLGQEEPTATTPVTVTASSSAGDGAVDGDTRTGVPKGASDEAGQHAAAYVALCLAVKSEEPEELRHWIEYHRDLGVGKFYVYDESSVSLAAELVDLTASGLVDYQQLWEPRGQLAIYAMCLENPGSKQHQYMGFIDVDEFLVVRDAWAADLPALLKRFEGKFGGLAVNWRLFGSSGHARKPAGPVTANFWRCLPAADPQNWQIKSIVSVREVVRVGPDPHTFVYRAGNFAANTQGQAVRGALSSSFVEDSLVLFHYVVKSKEEFQAKMLRGSGMGNHRRWEFFDEMDMKATDDCMDLLPSAAGARVAAPGKLGRSK